MLGEPWDTLLFLVVIPLLIQLFKVIRDNGGAEPSPFTKEVIALVLSAGFVIVSGGLAGIPFPAAPACSGLAGCIAPWITFLAEAVAFLAAAWVIVEGFYAKVLKALFENAGFATRNALAERAAKKARG